MKPTIIYIHGFASNFNSSKGLLLENSFKNYTVIHPTISADVKEAISQIKQIIKSVENPILVGSSLGGFYVDYFNTIESIPSVIINPLVDSTLIKVYIGENLNLYTNEKFLFTLESYDYLQQLKIEKEESINYKNRKANMLILLSKDDDVLDYKTAELEYIQQRQKVYTYETGGHRFLMDSEVISKVEEILMFLCSP